MYCPQSHAVYVQLPPHTLHWCCLQIENMEMQLNATLVKAVLQVHDSIKLTEESLSLENTGPHSLKTAVAEVKLKEKLKWNQKQVTAFVDLSHIPFDLATSVYASLWTCTCHSTTTEGI